MKQLKKFSLLFTKLLPIFGFAVLLIILYICAKLIPNAVSYTLSTAENTSEKVQNTENVNHLYENVYVIAEDGPFDITADGQDICVFSENRAIYRIKANLNEFPKSDRESIFSGIHVADKAMLYEIVEYMES